MNKRKPCNSVDYHFSGMWNCVFQSDQNLPNQTWQLGMKGFVHIFKDSMNLPFNECQPHEGANTLTW